MEIRDVAGGLWIWRREHPHWKPGQSWAPVIASARVESRGEVLVPDPLAPTAGTTGVWQRLGLVALYDGRGRNETPLWLPGQLPFERMIVSHGEPVHTRAAYERALELTPWGG